MGPAMAVNQSISLETVRNSFQYWNWLAFLIFFQIYGFKQALKNDYAKKSQSGHHWWTWFWKK